jgi:hypothetical protein
MLAGEKKEKKTGERVSSHKKKQTGESFFFAIPLSNSSGMLNVPCL